MTDTSMTVSAAGRKGGKSRSADKLSAVRKNGKRGGRPKGSKDKDTHERMAEAWREWNLVMANAIDAGLYSEVSDIAPMYDANTRSIRIRTLRLEKLIAERVQPGADDTSDRK